MSRPGFGNELPAVFPDWSPYTDLDSAARAYLRDPEIALDALPNEGPVLFLFYLFDWSST